MNVSHVRRQQDNYAAATPDSVIGDGLGYFYGMPQGWGGQPALSADDIARPPAA